jgi:dimethylhistidine N-methyltransferase
MAVQWFAPGQRQLKRLNMTVIEAERLQFMHDMQTALSQSPKRISPKYFYDQAGSVLFDRICDLPEYYPTRTELSILQSHAADMARYMGEQPDIIEFGAGSLQKIRYLLKAAINPARYLPMDISRVHLQQATSQLQNEFPQLDIQPLVADYTQLWDLPVALPNGGKRVAFFPGSTIGNFSPEQAQVFFENCAQHLRGGALLIGVDLIKSPEVLHAAYNDAQGVTAEFNLNVLARANRELGCDFDLSQFAHSAFYNAPLQRIEMHLLSLQAQTVHLNGVAHAFQQGETLHTEYSHKFTTAGLQQAAQWAGLQAGPVWTDPAHYFGLLWFDIPHSQETTS